MKIKMRTSYSNIIIIGLLLASCSGRLDNDPSRDSLIGVRAGVSRLDLQTRATVEADAYLGTSPSVNPLDANVWFSVNSSTFGTGGTAPTYLPCHSTASFTSDGYTYPDDALHYPTDNTTVYCVGLYPQLGWGTADGGVTAYHSIDGVTDIMFAPSVSGTWNDPFEDPLQFGHLLAWLKVCVYAHEYDAIAAWGAVTEVSIENPYTRATVTFSDGSIAYSEASQTLKIFEGATDLKVTSQQLGSIFCAPATSYNITVKTENVPAGRTVPVSLTKTDGITTPTIDEIRGYVYVLTLNFHTLSMIDAACTLEDWEDEYDKIVGS